MDQQELLAVVAQGLCAPQADFWVGVDPFFPLDLTRGLKQFADDFTFITSKVFSATAAAIRVPIGQLPVTAASCYFFCFYCGSYFYRLFFVQNRRPSRL